MHFSDQAIVLKRFNLGEADRLITLLTRNRGKLTVVAKGIRRPTSRKGGNLELFNQIIGFFVETKGLPLITEVRLLSPFNQIKKDLEKVGQSFYVCELADLLLKEGQSGYRVFSLLLGVLQKMDSPRFKVQDLRGFEIQLLKALGYWSDEVQGGRYPVNPKLQAQFNRVLIQNIIEKELKSPKFLEKVQFV